MLLVLSACGGPDAGDDTGAAPADAPSFAEAEMRIPGDAGDMAGNTVAAVEDSDGTHLVVGGLGGRVTCVLPYTAGETGLRDAPTCLTEATDYDFAGTALAGADADADGDADLLIGAPGSTSGAGAAWLIASPLPVGENSVSTGTPWYGEAAGDALGTTVAMGGDANQDGLADVILGAPGADHGDPDAGAVYLTAPGADLLEATRFYGGAAVRAVHSTRPSGDAMGGAVCASTDLDGDGIDDVAVGVQGSDRGADNGGAVGIFAGPVSGDHTLDDADTLLLSSRASSYTGSALACGGDTDGDGRGELLVGADDDGAGRAYLWRGGTLEDATVFLGNTDGDQAGYALDFVPGSPAGVVIAAPSSDLGVVDAGLVAVFSAPVPSGSVPLSDGACWRGEDAGDLAGTAVTGLEVEGEPAILVGAPYNRDPAPLGGAAYVLLLPDPEGGATAPPGPPLM